MQDTSPKKMMDDVHAVPEPAISPDMTAAPVEDDGQVDFVEEAYADAFDGAEEGVAVTDNDQSAQAVDDKQPPAPVESSSVQSHSSIIPIVIALLVAMVLIGLGYAAFFVVDAA